MPLGSWFRNHVRHCQPASVRPRLEALEERLAPALSLSEFSLPAGVTATSLTAGPDGALWFAEASGNKIGRISTAGAVSEFNLPTNRSDPSALTAGPDGALWFTEFHVDSVGFGGGATITDGKIGRITTGGSVIEYPLPVAASKPIGITAGPDGALWFTESASSKIGRISTAGDITEYSVSGPTLAVTAGPDGALWFTEATFIGSSGGEPLYSGSKVGRISTAGAVTEYNLAHSDSPAFGITAGRDGALWFAEYYTNKIGRITTGGVITEYDNPTAFARPNAITSGPDGALWFTESNSGKTGRVSTSGAVTEFNVSARSITTGPDNALWLVETNGKVGRLTFPAPVVAGGSVTATAGAAFAQGGSFSGDPLSFTATVDYGDGGGVQPLPLASTNFLLRHTYVNPGAYSITVAVNNGFAVGTGTFAVQVNPPSVITTPAPPDDLYGPHPNADAGTAFVKGLYRGVLGRDGDAAGVAYWLSVLSAGGTRDQVARGFVNSFEHRRQQVNAYYLSLLGRPALEAASSYWVNLLVADGDEAEVIRGIVTSAEYNARQASDAAFVGDLYLRLLGRPAEDAGLTYWEGQLAAGASRAAVADGILHSQEAAVRSVESNYAGFLQRPGDAGRDYWLAQLTAGTLTFGGAEAGFLGSDEFYQNARNRLP